MLALRIALLCNVYGNLKIVIAKILRNFKLVLAVFTLYLCIATEGQNARSYDTNDWIPITPSSKEEEVKAAPKRATGRVLNIDAPAQKFFPENEYRKRKPQQVQQVQQYLRETVIPKNHRQQKQKLEQPYKFENIANYQPKQVQTAQLVQQNPPPLQYFTNQEVKLQNVEQPPPYQQPQLIPQQQQYQQPQFIYQQQPQLLQQYSQNGVPQLPDPNYYQQIVPVNNTLYQTINPNSINQELLGTIQSNKDIPSAVATKSLEPSKPNNEEQKDKETVQLLYVPLENLKSSQTIAQNSQNVYNTALPRQEKQIGSFTTYTPNPRLASIEQDFIRQALEAQKLQEQIRSGQPLLYETTTQKPKKRKPHQPPLAVYMGGEREAEVVDVLDALKGARTIAVQDNFRSNSPKVFIGPSSLNPPDGYSKFPLPYLNNVEGNRVERKIEQLPFFVAPLSYKTPEGYSKIPLPSPHVGSVVISTKDNDHEKHQAARPQNILNQYQYVEKPQTNQYSNIQNSQEYLLQQQPTRQEQQQSAKINNNLQFDIANNQYQIQTRSPPKLSITTPNPAKQVYDVDSQGQLFLHPNEQNIYQQQEIPSGVTSLKDSPTQYQIPISSTTPQLTVDDIGQYHIPVRSTPKPANIEDINSYEIPLRETSTTKNTTPLPSVPINNYEKTRTSVEITPSIEITPKSVVKSSLKEQLRKEAVPTFAALSNNQQLPPSINQQINPLELAINQYELEEINSQFVGKPQKQEPQQQQVNFYENGNFGNTQFISSTPTYEQEYITTTKTSKPKRRGRPTRPISRNPTTYDNTKYLDDYNVRSRSSTPRYIESTEVNITPAAVYKTTTSTTESYTEEIPSKVYKLNSKVQPAYTENRPSLNQHSLNRDVLDQHILKTILTENSQNQQTSKLLTEQRQQYENIPVDTRVEPLDPSQYTPSGADVVSTFNEPHNQVLSGYLSNLQDQSVRALLVPNLLVPTTEQQKEILTTQKYEPITEREIETTPATTTTTEPPHVETTTLRRSRGRVRANSARYTTAPPRRTVNRRRPTAARTTTERTQSTTDYGRVNDSTRRSINSKQRFRTRGRTQNTLNDRISQTSTTENEIKAFKQPELQSGFQASPVHVDPQSYMQFEHTIDEQKIITIKPDDVSEESPIAAKGYHQVYDLPSQVEKEKTIQYENTGNAQKPVVDIKITHPASGKKEVDIITTPTKDAQYVQFSSNIKSGETYSKNSDEVTTSRPTIRIRGRGRGRSRYPSSTTTTTTTTEKQNVKDENEEFYGFFRQPDFTKPKIIETTQEPVQYYSPSTVNPPVSKTVYNEEFVANGYSTEQSELSSPIRFVGEIRPKYFTSTPQYDESKISITAVELEPETEAPKPKIRSRIRTPNRNLEESSSNHRYNEISGYGADQSNKRSSAVRSRGRGNTHYRLPEKLRVTTDEADIEGGNYPTSYLKNKETTTQEPQTFQITVDPNLEEELEDDQSPHPSIYSPKFVPQPKEQWVEASAVPFVNDLPTASKKEIEAVNSDSESNTEPVALPIIASTETITEAQTVNVLSESSREKSELLTQINDMIPVEDTTTTEEIPVTKPIKKKGRRRGVWKLVRHRPVDQFETAESQNYESVLNNFDTIRKVQYEKHYYEPPRKQKPVDVDVDLTTTEAPVTVNEEEVTTIVASSTEGSLFDTLYDMFGINNQNKGEQNEEITTTTASPTFPQEITEDPIITTTQTFNSTTEKTTEKDFEETTTAIDYVDLTTKAATAATKSNYEVEPWEMKAVKTSTSTEVSHETEICYKGRCVKSLNRKVRS